MAGGMKNMNPSFEAASESRCIHVDMPFHTISIELDNPFRRSLSNKIYVLQLLESIQIAEKIEKPPLSDLFTDVYDNLPSNLQEQEKLLRETIERNPQNTHLIFLFRKNAED